MSLKMTRNRGHKKSADESEDHEFIFIVSENEEEEKTTSACKDRIMIQNESVKGIKGKRERFKIETRDVSTQTGPLVMPDQLVKRIQEVSYHKSSEQCHKIMKFAETQQRAGNVLAEILQQQFKKRQRLKMIWNEYMSTQNQNLSKDMQLSGRLFDMLKDLPQRNSVVEDKDSESQKPASTLTSTEKDDPRPGTSSQ